MAIYKIQTIKQLHGNSINNNILMFLNYETNTILALKRQVCYYSAQISSVWIQFSSMLRQ